MGEKSQAPPECLRARGDDAAGPLFTVISLRLTPENG
jgi:hypothetical protein